MYHSQNQLQPNDEVDELKNRYIVYKVANELYASPLISIREVIKQVEIKAVPFMVKYFKGVINLRGQIVSVVDLVEKLELVPKIDQKIQRLILIVETSQGLIGALIDDVELVADFEEKSIERNPSVEVKVPVEYFLGIARMEDRLVNLLHLGQALEADHMKLIRAVK
jgi:purine-binding chemotaxis protein CheW